MLDIELRVDIPGANRHLEYLPRRHGLGLAGFDYVAFYGQLSDSLDVDAIAVVADFDPQHITDHTGLQVECADLWLAHRAPLLGRLDAVIDGVADQVEQGVFESVEDFAVGLYRFAAAHQLNLTTELSADRAHCERIAVEQHRHRDHAEIAGNIVERVDQVAHAQDVVAQLTLDRPQDVLVIQREFFPVFVKHLFVGFSGGITTFIGALMTLFVQRRCESSETSTSQE